MLSRREFLAGVSASGVIAIAPNKTIPGSGREKLILTALVDEMKKEQSYPHYSFSFFDQANEDNLRYAYQKIKPKKHSEMAFVVACGSQSVSIRHLVDEYLRRRNNETSLLPDWGRLPPEDLGLPDTYRILIFREQLISYLWEWAPKEYSISADFKLDAEILFDRILKNQMSLDEFYDGIWRWYKIPYKKEDVRKDYEAITYYAPYNCPYIWCSTIAERAIEAVSYHSLVS